MFQKITESPEKDFDGSLYIPLGGSEHHPLYAPCPGLRKGYRTS